VTTTRREVLENTVDDGSLAATTPGKTRSADALSDTNSPDLANSKAGTAKYLPGIGGAGYVNESLGDLDAIKAYEQIASTQGDTAKIASHYGLPENVVAFVKQHFFIKEHTVAVGPGKTETGKFTPYDTWADLWNKATQGKYDAGEVKEFLAHEYIEGRLMEAGFSYNSAHPDYWLRLGGYPSPTSQHFGAHDLSYSPRGFDHWLSIFKDRPEMLDVAKRLTSQPLADDLSNLDDFVEIIIEGVPRL
jgi:hypothetical protein